ncbi:MAG: glycoside hydrolase family 130 protein, partial [Bryocella sp.]
MSWELTGFTRAASAPVITPSNDTFHDPVTGTDVAWEKLHTFNPAAVVRDGKIYVLYRAEDASGEMKIGGHVSRLGLASSTDGIHFERRATPVFYPDNDAQASREQPGGTEDPRLVETADGTYVLTYTQYSRKRNGYSVGIATSTDLVHWQKHGPAFGDTGKYSTFKYKSAGILTRLTNGKLLAAKLNGKYWMYWGEVEVRLATSDDLIHWTPVEDASGKPIVLLHNRPGRSDSKFPEVGPPPMLTDKGILLLYNAKNASGSAPDPALAPDTYSVQEAL